MLDMLFLLTGVFGSVGVCCAVWLREDRGPAVLEFLADLFLIAAGVAFFGGLALAWFLRDPYFWGHAGRRIINFIYGFLQSSLLAAVLTVLGLGLGRLSRKWTPTGPL
jgi:hypothetical protein